MGWASGIYTRIFGSTGWQNDKAALIKILASRHDTHDQDLGDGLNTLRTELRGEALTNATKVLTSVAGTNTITASMTSATPAGTLTAYSAGMTVVLTPAATNTGATTLNINSLGALDVMNPDGSACTGGELVSGVTTRLTLDAGADDWIITNPAHPGLSATWTFTKQGGSPSASAIYINTVAPSIGFRESNATGDNRRWDNLAFNEALIFRAVNEAENAVGVWMQVDRNGTTIDRVAFPFEASGGVAVGTVSGAVVNSSAFYVRGTSRGAAHLANNAATAATLNINNEDTSGNNIFVRLSTESAGLGTERGSIDFNRAGVVTRYNTTCDGTLKTLVVDAGSAIELIMGLRVRSFEWIENGFRVNHGFIAQETHKLFPDAVSVGDETRPWGMDFSKLVPALTKALQETIQRCASLESRVRDLERR